MAVRAHEVPTVVISYPSVVVAAASSRCLWCDIQLPRLAFTTMRLMKRRAVAAVVKPATAASACAAVLVTASVAPAVAQDNEAEVPILGQAAGTPSLHKGSGDREALISLHGVRRVEGATAVYWSVGWMPDSGAGDKSDLMNTAGPQSMGLARPHSLALADVAAVDIEGRQAYTPMHQDKDCLCSHFSDALPSDPEAGTAYVAYAALPELPQSISTVTVKVAGRVFPSVPVEEGAMTPELPADEPIVVGTGWPKVDLGAVSAIDDPSPFVYPVSLNSKLEGTSLGTRDEGQQQNIDLAADVLFDVDKADLTSAARKEIKAAADLLEESGTTGEIMVVGHTDSDGSDSHNQDLSERRAKAVAKELEPLLPSGLTVKTDGRGESEPITTNSTAEGKAQNRRVTITSSGGTS